MGILSVLVVGVVLFIFCAFLVEFFVVTVNVGLRRAIFYGGLCVVERLYDIIVS
jgi:hypothetical protein